MPFLNQPVTKNCTTGHAFKFPQNLEKIQDMLQFILKQTVKNQATSWLILHNEYTLTFDYNYE